MDQKNTANPGAGKPIQYAYGSVSLHFAGTIR